MHRYFASLEH